MCHGESGETDMPPVPGPNVPSADSVSDGKAPSLRLLGPIDGKPRSVGVIARKYSVMVTNLACSKSLAYLDRTIKGRPSPGTNGGEDIVGRFESGFGDERSESKGRIRLCNHSFQEIEAELAPGPALRAAVEPERPEE